jgi:hypothetical protein
MRGVKYILLLDRRRGILVFYDLIYVFQIKKIY